MRAFFPFNFSYKTFPNRFSLTHPPHEEFPIQLYQLQKKLQTHDASPRGCYLPKFRTWTTHCRHTRCRRTRRGRSFASCPAPRPCCRSPSWPWYCVWPAPACPGASSGRRTGWRRRWKTPISHRLSAGSEGGEVRRTNVCVRRHWMALITPAGIRTLAALELYGSSNSDHICGFMCCHQETVPFR